MNWLLLFFAIVFLVILKVIYDSKKTEQKILNQIKQTWGQVSEEKYTQEKLKSIAYFYQEQHSHLHDIDNITWNDIDMEQIYFLVNQTKSAIGEEYLYYLLRHLEWDLGILKERNRLITFFQTHEQERIQLQMALSRMGKLWNIGVYEYISQMQKVKKPNSTRSIFCAFGFCASILLCFIPGIFQIGIIGTVFFLANNIIVYYKEKAGIENYFVVLSYLIRLLSNAKKISKFSIPELKKYTDELTQFCKEFKHFERGSYIVLGGRNMGGGLEDILLDYIRMLFHIDLIKFTSMVEEIQKHKESFEKIFNIIGLIDSMIAAASFRELLQGDYSEPVFEEKGSPFLAVKEVYHPMLDKPVKNSIQTKQGILITGSNASGKSTFLKSMAINAILAQTIYTSTSKYYHCSFFRVFSSMALKDDLMEKESYYIVEIKSLKRILDSLSEKIPVLCFVDEVLRGTNTLERIAASSQILHSLSIQNSICFAATHDIELTHILEEDYLNYHFQEQIVDKEILFDYCLYTGRAVSRNAIKLLSIMGYKEEIIEQATDEVNYFIENGNWRKIYKNKIM